VPLGELKALLKRATAWRFDQAAGRWTRVTSAAPARPGEVLVMAAADGGYDPQTGLDTSVRRAVPDCPSLDEPPDAGLGTDQASGGEDAYGQDDASVAQPDWLQLDRHSEDVRRQAEALLGVIGPDLPPGTGEAVLRASYAHDAGKAHEIWQDALCKLAGPDERERVSSGQPWAKSPRKGRLRYRDGVRFRHELVSMLLLDGPLSDLLSGVDDPDLVRYLVLAHHGKLRVQVREPQEESEKVLLGLRDGDLLPMEVLGRSGHATVDLERFRLGGEQSWTRTALQLRDRYGPFVLAYLETLVRIADWRASAGLEEAT
jgi:CRISPR-associated endonuclease/helicase Cas3